MHGTRVKRSTSPACGAAKAEAAAKGKGVKLGRRGVQGAGRVPGKGESFVPPLGAKLIDVSTKATLEKSTRCSSRQAPDDTPTGETGSRKSLTGQLWNPEKAVGSLPMRKKQRSLTHPGKQSHVVKRKTKTGRHTPSEKARNNPHPHTWRAMFLQSDSSRTSVVGVFIPFCVGKSKQCTK